MGMIELGLRLRTSTALSGNIVLGLQTGVSAGLPPNTAPLANPDVASTPQDTAVVLRPLDNDTDADSDALTISQASVPLGQGSVINDGTTLTFTPAPGFVGDAVITYRVFDGTDTDEGTATVTVTPVVLSQDNQVLSFAAEDVALIRDDMQAFGMPTGELDAQGVFFSSMVYFDGVLFGNQRIMGLADPASGSHYLQIQPRQVIFRDGGANITLNVLSTFGNLSAPGWYLVTARVWKVGNTVQAQLWRDDLVSGVGDFGDSFNIGRLTRLGWSCTPDDTPDFGSYDLYGLTVGTGDPAAFHAAIYNNGAFLDPSSHDFASDPNADLLLYEAGTRQSNTLDPFDVSHLGAGWSAVGSGGNSVVWQELPPAYVGGEFGAVSTRSVQTSGGASTFEVVTTLPTSDWGTPTVDPAMVDLFVQSGFGGIQITGSSVAVNGGVATVTFDLSRQIYQSEELVCALDEGWLIDDARNRSGIAAAAAVVNGSSVQVPALVPGISHAGIGFDFAQPQQAGVTADGVIWVLNPGGGVVIQQKYPLQTSLEQGGAQRVLNGTMKNPQRTNAQGYSGYGGFTHFGNYVPTLTVSFPEPLVTDETMIGVRNNLDYDTANGGRDGHPVNILTYQGLIVVDAVPGPNDFAPPLVGYDATDRPGWRTVDTDAIAAALPVGYDTATMDKPDFEVLLSRIERFNPALFQFPNVEMKREMTPSGFTDADGYGVNFIATTGSVLLVPVSDESTLAQRQRAVRAIVHHYRQWYGLGGLSRDGGHNQGAFGILAAGDHWVNGGAGLPTLLEDTRGNESTVFEIEDQAMLDTLTLPHTGGSDLPRYNQLSDVSDVAGSQIRLARIDNLSGSSLRDATRGLAHLIMVRPSDGAEANLTGYNDNTGVLSLNPIPADMAIGDMIYFRAPWPQQVGDVAWVLRTENGFKEYSPSANAPYRQLNQWSAQVLALQALGIIHPSFERVRRYVEISNASGQPTADNDFPSHHNTFAYGPNEGISGTSHWVQQFWGQHWETIQLVPQLY